MLRDYLAINLNGEVVWALSRGPAKMGDVAGDKVRGQMITLNGFHFFPEDVKPFLEVQDIPPQEIPEDEILRHYYLSEDGVVLRRNNNKPAISPDGSRVTHLSRTYYAKNVKRIYDVLYKAQGLTATNSALFPINLDDSTVKIEATEEEILIRVKRRPVEG